MEVASMKIQWCRTPQLSFETEVSFALLCQLFLPCYTAVRIKNCLKSTSVIKVATMKNTDNFRCTKEASLATTKLLLFNVSKDEWNTKEDTGKSLSRYRVTASVS